MGKSANLIVLAMVTLTLSGCAVMSRLVADVTQRMRALPDTGTCAEYLVVPDDPSPITPDLVEQALLVIEGRIAATGIADAVVRSSAEGRLLVGLPDLSPESDRARTIRAIVQAPAVLELVPVPETWAGEVLTGIPAPDAIVETEPLLTGEDVAHADVRQDPATGRSIVELELDPIGAQILDDHAAEHVGGRMAILLDGFVLSAPTINAASFEGRVQISGDFTSDEAAHLVASLRLQPLEIREVAFASCETSGPTG